MQKTEYLIEAPVIEFVDWFRLKLGEENPLHKYTIADGTTLQFAGIKDALQKYEWEFRIAEPSYVGTTTGRSYRENHTALTSLKKGLVDSLRSKTVDDAITRDASIAVMHWGGVVAHNVKWLRANYAGITEILCTFRDYLNRNEDQLSELNTALEESVGRFNAGMTKIFSLICDDLIIYDSRVAASLAWFVSSWCHETEREDVPNLLRFPCMPPKEGKNPRTRKLRNPTCEHYAFPPMNSYITPALHAHWNLRATWILSDALAKTKSSAFHKATGATPGRALEAALFMWGYDLQAASHCVRSTRRHTRSFNDAVSSGVTLSPNVTRVLKEVSRAGSERRRPTNGARVHSGVTLGGRAREFNWWFDVERDEVVVDRPTMKEWDRFPIGDIFRIMHALLDWFGYDWFPLANNVTKIHDGSEIVGLGTTIMGATPNVPMLQRPSQQLKNRAQAASQLGVILEQCGILENNMKQIGICWRFREAPPETFDDLRTCLDVVL